MGEQLKFVQLEIMVLVVGLLVLIADLAMAPTRRRLIGYISAGALGLIFLFSLRENYVNLANESTEVFFNSRYKIDGLALFFKRFFILSAITRKPTTFPSTESIGTVLPFFCSSETCF